MEVRRTLLATSLVVLGSQAIAENWVTVATRDNIGHVYSVDKDSIRRESDGLVYFTTRDAVAADHAAADCQRRVIYTLDESYGGEPMELPDWRNSGETVEPGSTKEAELQYACANAG